MSPNIPPPPAAAKLEPGDLVTETEAAAILGVSRQTISNWRWRGIGPRFRKIGLRMVRYKRADLARFIDGDVGERSA